MDRVFLTGDVLTAAANGDGPELLLWRLPVRLVTSPAAVREARGKLGSQRWAGLQRLLRSVQTLPEHERFLESRVTHFLTPDAASYDATIGRAAVQTPVEYLCSGALNSRISLAWMLWGTVRQTATGIFSALLRGQGSLARQIVNQGFSTAAAQIECSQSAARLAKHLH